MTKVKLDKGKGDKVYNFLKVPVVRHDYLKYQRRTRQLEVLVRHFSKAREKGDFDRVRVIGFKIIPLVRLLGLTVEEIRALFLSS